MISSPGRGCRFGFDSENSAVACVQPLVFNEYEQISSSRDERRHYGCPGGVSWSPIVFRSAKGASYLSILSQSERHHGTRDALAIAPLSPFAPRKEFS